MAKDAGSTRASKWEGDIYTLDGVRHEYRDLPAERQKVIQATSKEVAKEMWNELKDKKVNQVADGKQIVIEFDHRGVDHVARDAMIILSGKYMSKGSMVHIDRILESSTYIPTQHSKSHERTDARQMWFKYRDSQGRGLYFSVAHSPSAQKKYTLYSVSDEPPK